MATILYSRVSTVDQTAAHQLTQAKAAGFKIDDVVSDEGVSGVTTTLAERPQGKRLFDMLRAGDVLVVRWVDRLGRNYASRPLLTAWFSTERPRTRCRWPSATR